MSVHRLLAKLAIGACAAVGFASQVFAASPEGMKLYAVHFPTFGYRQVGVVGRGDGKREIHDPGRVLSYQAPQG